MPTISEKLIKANEFIKQMGLDPYAFMIYPIETESILIDFPDMEIISINEKQFGLDNFNEECNQSISIDYPTKFFYNKKYKVVNSTWEYLIIEINDGIYAKLYKDVVYEWDDCK